MSDTEHRIRELAYRLWEEAGRPEGRDDDFWHAANDLIAQQGAEGEATAPVAPAGSPPPPDAAAAPPANPAPAAAPKAKPVAAKAAAVAVDKPSTAARKTAPRKS